MKRLKEWGDEIKRRFSTPLTKISGSGDKLILKFDGNTKINQLVLKEDIRLGERIRSFIVEGKTKNGWEKIVDGSCVGHKFIHVFDGLEVSAVRLRIPKADDNPVVTDFSIYYWEN